MNSDASIAAYLSIAPKDNGKKISLVLLSFFTNIWQTTVDMLLISVVEKYFRLGLNYLIPLKKS